MFHPAGPTSYWPTSRIDRLEAAESEWDGDTAWSPVLSRTVFDDTCYSRDDCRGVWINGYDPASIFTNPLYQGTLAYNKRDQVLRYDPRTGEEYYDIEDWDIFFNTAAPGHPTFTYSSGSSSDLP